MTELLPCPFCQSEAKAYPPTLNETHLDTDPILVPGRFYSIIRCSKCSCVFEGPQMDHSMEKVIAAWNTRPSPWRDIATGPKDGTIVDLWEPSGREADCYWDRSLGGWSSAELGFLHGNISPTHWMPIPDGPKED